MNIVFESGVFADHTLIENKKHSIFTIIARGCPVVETYFARPRDLSFPWSRCLASADMGFCGKDGGPTLIPDAISIPAFMVGTQAPEK